jgi:hypothetical protein
LRGFHTWILRRVGRGNLIVYSTRVYSDHICAKKCVRKIRHTCVTGKNDGLATAINSDGHIVGIVDDPAVGSTEGTMVGGTGSLVGSIDGSTVGGSVNANVGTREGSEDTSMDDGSLVDSTEGSLDGSIEGDGKGSVVG